MITTPDPLLSVHTINSPTQKSLYCRMHSTLVSHLLPSNEEVFAEFEILLSQLLHQRPQSTEKLFALQAILCDLLTHIVALQWTPETFLRKKNAYKFLSHSVPIRTSSLLNLVYGTGCYNMVCDPFLCTTLTGRRGSHAPFMH